MMKRIAFIVAFILACGVAQAATVHLKNGSTVSGKIIAKTADSVKLDVSGVTLTYYNDEIDRMDEADAPVAAPAEPVAPAPADKVEPVVAAPPVVSNDVVMPPATPPVVAPVVPSPVAPTPVAAVPLPVAAAPSQADVYAGMSKKDLIMKFIDVFGTRKSMGLNFDQMATKLSPQEAEVFKKTFKVDEIIERMVPLYDKHFSEADLKTLIDFYSSPTGKRLVETIPTIMTESVEVSAKYFEDHMQAMAGGLKQSGALAQPAQP
jgi:hypothetical protein